MRLGEGGGRIRVCRVHLVARGRLAHVKADQASRLERLVIPLQKHAIRSIRTSRRPITFGCRLYHLSTHAIRAHPSMRWPRHTCHSMRLANTRSSGMPNRSAMGSVSSLPGRGGGAGVTVGRSMGSVSSLQGEEEELQRAGQSAASTPCREEEEAVGSLRYNWGR